MNREIFRDNSIGLLILAGGKSERMGSDKAGLILGDLTFSQTLAESMGLYSERLFSSAKGPAPCGFSLIADSQKLTGKRSDGGDSHRSLCVRKQGSDGRHPVTALLQIFQ